MGLHADQADDHPLRLSGGSTDPPGVDFHHRFVDLVNLEFELIQGFLLAGCPRQRSQTGKGVARQHAPEIADDVTVVVVTGWFDQIKLDFRFMASPVP